MNFETKMCRACLIQSEKLQPLFFGQYSFYDSDSVLNMFINCTSLEATEYDQYPKHICDNCLTDLRKAYDFWKRCRNSVEKLNNRNKNVIYFESKVEVKPEINTGSIIEQDPLKTIICNDVNVKEQNEILIYPKSELNISLSTNLESRQNNIRLSLEKDTAKNSVCELKNNGTLSEDVASKSEENICTEIHESKTFDLEQEINNKINFLESSILNQKVSPEMNTYIKPASKRNKISLKKVIKKGVDKTEKSHLCHECGKTFLKPHQLTSHLRVHSGIKPYKCETCNAQVKDYSNFMVHLRTHNREASTKYSCDQCNKVFGTWSGRYYHIKRNHSPKQFICEVCSKAFGLKQHLKQHFKIHTGERPHICNECGKCFRVKSILREHMLIHAGEKKFSCTVCDKRFTGKKHVVQHMVTHTGIRKHKCEICQKAFTQRHVLRSHLKMHEKDK